MTEIVYEVSDFVAIFNQTLEYAYPSVTIMGELANFRVSKGKWVYFDLKDDFSSVKFFGTVYMIPGPLEDGMLLQVTGVPRLHQLYGFSVTAQTVSPVGEGSIKRAAALLEGKLSAEGLFEPSRKRPLPYPPNRIGLITSSESAAYADFTKILTQRWGGVDVELIDVQVQGEAAVEQIVRAITRFNEMADTPEVLVITRGGGSAEDLAAFSSEQVTRAVAASRIPTIVAIGHEIDLSLAERAADCRASTPSNAAELLVPDRRDEQKRLQSAQLQLSIAVKNLYDLKKVYLDSWMMSAQRALRQTLQSKQQVLHAQSSLLEALSPQAVLRRGYAVLRLDNTIVRSGKTLQKGQKLTAQVPDARIDVTIDSVTLQ